MAHFTKTVSTPKDHRLLYPEQFSTFIAQRPVESQDAGCNAPFTNIYFGHSGKAVACCFNRLHVLGTYPEMSIREIWNGPMANELRDAMKGYDYSVGCQNCLHQIIAGNLAGTKANKWDGHPSHNNGYPSVMQFELSNTCNLECVMCNGDYSSLIRKNRENRSPLLEPYDIAFVDQLEEFIPYLSEVQFYGGEPFLVDIYYEIWERIIAIKPTVRIQVQTNGTILHKRTRTLLERGRFDINVSLDSVSKENCENIRVNSKYEQIMDHIAYFHQYCRMKRSDFRLSSCIMRQNYQEAGDLIRFANSLDTEIYFHAVYHPSHSALHKMDPKEIIAARDSLLQAGRELPQTSAVEKYNHNQLTDYIKMVEQWISDRQAEVSLPAIESMKDLLAYVHQEVSKRYDLSAEKRAWIIEIVTDKLVQANNLLPSHINMAKAIYDLINPHDEYLTSFTDNIISLEIEEINNNVIKYNA